MSWRPLPAIAYAVATHPFSDVQGDDLPLDIGDELYILEQGGINGDWFRGYMCAQPSLLSGLTPLREGQGLEQRIYSGTFPKSCVEIKEVLFEDDGADDQSSRTGSDDSIRDSLGQIINANKAQERLAFKDLLLEQLANNTLPIPAQDALDEKPQAPVPHLKAVDEDSSNSSEPLIDEIASCLKEWYSEQYHKLALDRQYENITELDELLKKLDFARRQLLHKVLTEKELELVREAAIWKMTRGNKILTGEVVVRSEQKLGRMMDAQDSPVELSSIQSTMSLLNEAPKAQAAEKSTLNHLLVDVKAIINASLDPTTLVFSLVTKANNTAPVTLTESFAVECKPQGSLESLNKQLRLATLFADLTAADIGDTAAGDTQVYLVIKANRTYVPIPLKPWEQRDPATLSREHLATPFHAANLGSINAGKGSIRRSIMMGSVKGSVKNVFSKSPTKSPTKLNTLQEAFEPPSTGEPRISTASSMTPPGTPGKAVSRTVAVGVFNLTKMMKETDVEVEAKVQLWIPSPAFDGIPQNKGTDWDEIVRQFLASNIGSYRRMPTLPKIELVLKPYTGLDSASLMRNKPTELSGVTPTAKIGFSGAPTKSRNDVYVTIDKANFPRNALLSRATGSATSLSQRSEFKNVQVRLEVHNHSGVTIENAIYASSNGKAASSYDTTVVDKNDAWNETIRLTISPGDVRGAHLVMLTSDAPNYPFAVSHLPLWHEDAFMRDGNHDLLMYKNEEGMSRALPDANGRGGYLNVKWNARGKDDVSKDEALTGPLSTLRIKTYLCSTRMSQDKVILGLLNWKTQEQADVVNHLKQLLFCPEIEVVKQLNEVFDSLFAILVEHSENETFEDLVFTALVHVLGIVYDRRFNLSPLVDKYAEEKFNFPFATPCLVRSFVRLLVATDPASSKKLRTTFKVTKHVLKFITRGRSQMIGKESDIGIANGSSGFSNQLSSLFNGLNSTMRSKEGSLIANQTIAAQHFHTWLPELDPMLSHDEIVHCAIDFIDAMRDAKGKLIIYKLILLIKFGELGLFSKDKSPLLHNTVRWIRPQWGAAEEMTPQYRDQVRLCCTILSTQINDLGNLADDHLPNVINSYMALLTGPRPLRTNNLSILFPRTYPFPVRAIDNKDDEFDEVLVELAAIFSAISNSEQGMQLDNIAGSKEELANLVYNTLKMQESILNAEAFPKSWLSLYVYHHRSAMRILEQVAAVLLESFLPGVEELSDEVVFLDELWKLFFTILFKLITSETLALETFAQQKRRAVWSIAGDVRKEGAKLLGKMWHAIGWETDQDEQIRFGLKRMGGFQVQYVPALVPATLIMCMHVHEDLCAAGTDVLKSMIASEWQLNESVAGIKTIIIDALDMVFRSKSFTEGSVQKNFIIELLNHFESRFIDSNDSMKVQIREMLYNIADFLDLLDAVHASGSTDEANQLIHRLALMEFLRDMDKTDTFIAYAHQLAAVQAAAGNFTEAGLALRHHADLYSWDPVKILPPNTDPSYPSQTEFERKEAIFHEMIQRFEEGETWSMALKGYEELACQYSDNTFDYKKAARTYKSIGNVYEQIAKPDRPLIRYFYVCYGGLGFAAEFSLRQYIHEGKAGEELAAFRDKIQEEYPEAQIIANVEDFKEQEGQYISVDVCTPLCDMHNLVYQRTKVPNVVKEFLATRHPHQFTITKKKFFAGSVDEHYVDKIVLYTEEPFPTISRRSQIIGADFKRLDPVETAIYRVQRVNTILATWEKAWFQKRDIPAFNLLVECLKLEVDTGFNKKAVVCTRALLPTANVKELTEENLEQFDPEQTSVATIPTVELNDHQKALKTALIDEAVIINRILSNFGVSDEPLLRAQAAALRETFEKAFEVELASIAPKATVKVEDYQRPWNFPALTKGNGNGSGFSAKPDNRVSNLSTLGPLPFPNQKPFIHKSRASSSMTSDDSSVSSKTDTPQRVRRASSFWKKATGRGDEDTDVTASAKKSQKTKKEKPKRGPPVSFNPSSSGNSGGKSIKRRDSDAASEKSARRSISSFSRRSFFSRNRANSIVTQDAVTDDGDSAWIDEGSSRFFSTSTDGHGQRWFSGPEQNFRYISDSILRGASSTKSSPHSTRLPSPPTPTQANLSQEQGRGGAEGMGGMHLGAGFTYDKIRKPQDQQSPSKGMQGNYASSSNLSAPSGFAAPSAGAQSIRTRTDDSLSGFGETGFGSDISARRLYDGTSREFALTGGLECSRPPTIPRSRASTLDSIGSLGSGMTGYDKDDVPVRVGLWSGGGRLSSNPRPARDLLPEDSQHFETPSRGPHIPHEVDSQLSAEYQESNPERDGISSHGPEFPCQDPDCEEEACQPQQEEDIPEHDYNPAVNRTLQYAPVWLRVNPDGSPYRDPNDGGIMGMRYMRMPPPMFEPEPMGGHEVGYEHPPLGMVQGCRCPQCTPRGGSPSPHQQQPMGMPCDCAQCQQQMQGGMGIPFRQRPMHPLQSPFQPPMGPMGLSTGMGYGPPMQYQQQGSSFQQQPMDPIQSHFQQPPMGPPLYGSPMRYQHQDGMGSPFHQPQPPMLYGSPIQAPMQQNPLQQSQQNPLNISPLDPGYGNPSGYNTIGPIRRQPLQSSPLASSPVTGMEMSPAGHTGHLGVGVIGGGEGEKTPTRTSGFGSMRKKLSKLNLFGSAKKDGEKEGEGKEDKDPKKRLMREEN